MVRPGTHITAMGSDTSEKCEIAPDVLKLADIVAADSIEQAVERGEISQALRANKCDRDKLIELGSIILNPSMGRGNRSLKLKVWILERRLKLGLLYEISFE